MEKHNYCLVLSPMKLGLMLAFLFLFSPFLNQVSHSYIGNALTLHGYDEYAWAPHSESLDLTGNQLTLEAWVQLSGTSGNHWIICKQNIDSIRSYGFYISAETRRVIPSIHADWHFEYDVGEAVLEYGTWYHVAIVYDGSRITTFVNGLFNGEAELTGDLQHNSEELTIGGTYWLPSDSTNGSIDEVRIWRVARTQAEIEANYQVSLSGDEPDLVGYWKFDEMEDLGVGVEGINDYRDYSGNGNHLDFIPASYQPCLGDFDGDGDVDGSDLATFIYDNQGISLMTFAENYGRNNCFSNGSTPPTIPPSVTYPFLDAVVQHTPDDPNNLTWASYVSSESAVLSEQYILLCADGGGDTYDDTINWAIGNSDWLGRNPHYSQFIIVSIAIHRNPIYAVTFPSAVFSEETDARFYRPDLKVNEILDWFIEELNDNGLNVNPRVLVSGFSNGGMFANRYTLLHPDRVKAAAIGQAGGALTLPMNNYNGVDILWPAGVYDFGLLTGKEFDFGTYASIPKFIYIGDMDTGPYQSTVYSPLYGWNLEIFSEEQCEFMYNLAPTDPERIHVQTTIMQGIGDNVDFRMYTGVGHDCPEECQNEVISFLKENS